ncbi:MAG TPA: ABC transporter substrate-binding protein [Thermodesulfobacteriota bacterium]|nr:ABC transporter substrate-binding protein [Thermodesulfobacteriota bacterium]
MKKQWLIVLVFLFSVTIFSPNHSVAQDEVKIGYLNAVISLPTFVALEKGYFQEQGLKAVNTPFESGSLLTDALVAGRLDVLGACSIIPLWLVEQNLPGTFKIFLVYGPLGLKGSSFVCMVAKDSPLKEMKDLKGKRVGTFPGIAALAIARAILRPHFDPNKEVTLIEVPPGNIVQALAAGQIDAYFTPEPFGMMAEAKGVGRYLSKSPSFNLPNGYPGAVFAFNSKFLKEKPILAKKVKAAIYKGVDFIQANEMEARKILSKYTNLPEPFAIKIPWDPWTKVEQYNKAFGQPYFELFKKEGLFQKHIDTTQLYYQD